jgi:D-alanyl-D-alanine carboxypeptidase
MLRHALPLAALLFASLPSYADPLEDALTHLIAKARAGSSASAVVLLASDSGERIVVIDGDATPQTRFYLASVGKTLVAAAVLNAVERGALDLDAPLGARVAGLPMAVLAATRTLRDLLGHTSGLPDYLDDAFYDDALARPAHRPSPAEALGYGDPNEALPRGSPFEYSNTNYVFLGAVLEGLDGSLGAAMNARVFAPAKMTASSVGAKDGPDLARGYDEDGRDVSAILWNSTLGDGPVVANAPDLERFIRALMESDRVIGGAVRAQMLRAAQPGSGYGLGIGVDGDEWGDWFGHSGGFDGAAADYRYYSEDGSIILVLANGDLDTDWVMDEAASIWFGQ